MEKKITPEGNVEYALRYPDLFRLVRMKMKRGGILGEYAWALDLLEQDMDRTAFELMKVQVKYEILRDLNS